MSDTCSPPPSCKIRERLTSATVIDLLAQTWLMTFSVYEKRRRPIAIGIHERVEEALAGAVTPGELHRALAVYTSNQCYLRALTKRGAVRVGLDGKPTDFVSEEDAAAAKALLEQARRKPFFWGDPP